jgi:hypothetical protein
VANRAGKIAVFTAMVAGLAAGPGWAQSDKPRFVLLLDNSTSMTQNLAGVQTHGDGSESQPGCNIDGKSTAGWAYDDSKLFLAKAAVIDTISAFGAAEFALATYSRTSLGQACGANSDCTARVAGATCEDLPGDGTTQKFCAYHGGDTYMECSPPGTGCVSCANPSDTNDLVFDWGSFDCLYTKCSYAAGCIGGQVIVGFPAPGTSNLSNIYQWIDGKEDPPPFTAMSNREIRAVTMTPLASALDSVRGWLTDASQTGIGSGAGLLSTTATARDPRASCRPYNIILITDGEDTCSPDSANDPVTAATAAYGAGLNVYVVGFGTGYSSVLNNMAMAGSGQKRPAYFASNRSDLIASLGDILINAIPKPKCNCDATCYDEAAAFPLKGQPCSVGVGRCKRQGVYGCNATGDGVVCATAAACGAPVLAAGTPVAEQCGTLAGCQAPTAADCADENCDGAIDEGLSCSCSAKPELCNGLDDNCNGVVDDIAQVPCGLNLGACKQGLTTCAADGAGGQQVVCKGVVGPTPEICDGIDNDCDGVVDDFALRCYPATTAGCTHDSTTGAWACVGACQTGFQVCSAGVWGSCVGAVTPVAEISCDGLDNNCDGRVDENNPLVTDRCYPANTVGCDLAGGKCVGECAFGHMACATNKMGISCVGSHVPIAELCNGKDDNCDGKIDEAFPTLGQPCNQESCQGAGQFVCNSAGTDVECSVSAAGPTPEVCDGRDNDCDGLIDEAPGPGEPAMPGVGVACGSAVGECALGMSVCTGGKIVCNGVGPVPEICDGKDNDCNGSIDDNLVVPADSCNPDGMAPGQPMVGECRPGTFVCRGGAGWKCQGGVGPTVEICDGKDNDCDGQIDNNATCSVGYICISGECVPTCSEAGESYQGCPADRYCKNGACIVKACALTPCATGLVCQQDGTCVDPCSLVTCPKDATCSAGVCTDCYSKGCLSGERCVQRLCKVDTCANKSCGAGQFCNAGACQPSCASVVCPAGETCAQGACVKIPCSSGCDSDSYCDATTVTCQPKHCAGVACPAGQVCVNATGKCTADPCEQVACATGKFCQVGDDGVADCAIPAIAGIAGTANASGSGIFSCSVASFRSSSDARHGLVNLVIALVAGTLLGSRRRRR